MALPLAYFLTWTCHGTWLHGDDRGSVDRDHNRRGTPLLRPDPARLERAEARMISAPQVLSTKARAVVDTTIRRHCQIRAWSLLALNVRTNHVHVVVDCNGSHEPEAVIEQFKAWSTRRLREAGLISHDAKLWTEHGSTRWINNREGLAEAVEYVMNGQ